MSIRTTIREIDTLVYSIDDDITKFESGNNSAGTRIRKAMQDIKSIAQEVRVAVQKEKNSRKVK